MKKIIQYSDTPQYVGQEIGVSEWHDIQQDAVNQFAALTGDDHWIHVDVARAQTESPFGGTVAHGFLTLSLLPLMLREIVEITGPVTAVNYGLNKIRFPQPVPVGSRVRLRMKLQDAKLLAEGRGVLLTLACEMEREGQTKTVLAADWLVAYLPA